MRDRPDNLTLPIVNELYFPWLERRQHENWRKQAFPIIQRCLDQARDVSLIVTEYCRKSDYIEF